MKQACASVAEEQVGDVVQVVREILSNIARHAQASEVGVYCSVIDGNFVVRIEGDGVGFDPESVERGHGLTNMEERAAALGGRLEIRSSGAEGDGPHAHGPAGR